jgi:endonuclease YncB( thermonuclease family)
MFLQLSLVVASRLSLIVGAILAPPGAAPAAELLAGPYAAVVEQVVDGDTLAVRVTVWLQQDLRVLVRLRGIDAPELSGKCPSEKRRAKEAASALGRLVADGSVMLTRIEGDKYFGRVLADVATPAGADVSLALMAGGFARPYDGRARGGWCEIGAAEHAEEIARAETP